MITFRKGLPVEATTRDGGHVSGRLFGKTNKEVYLVILPRGIEYEIHESLINDISKEKYVALDNDEIASLADTNSVYNEKFDLYDIMFLDNELGLK